MPRLSINTLHLPHIFERDWSGNWEPREQPKSINVQSTNSICAGDVSVSFRVAVRIGKDFLGNGDNEANLLTVSFLRSWLPGELAKSNYWDFYGLKWVTYVDCDTVDAQELYRPFELEVPLTDAMTKVVTEVAEHLGSLREKFSAHKEKLNNFAYQNTAYGFQATVGDARTSFRVIQDVLECSAQEGGYSSSDCRHAFRCYEDLARRKVEANHNYQVLLNRVQRFVSGVEFPEVWGKKPALGQAL
jgi:hypothetical protein